MALVTAETLAGIELFRVLPLADRKALAERCHAHQYRAKQQIVSRADKSTDVYFIVGGLVRVTTYSASGREVMFRDLNAGTMFGHVSAVDGGPRSASVVAVKDSFVASMPAKVFQEVLRAYPDLAVAVLKELARLVRLLSERVVDMSTLGVKNRIHAELLRLALAGRREDNIAVISPIPTHSEIASRISTHREAVTRELKRLGQRGLVERRRGALVVGDLARLRQLVEDVRGEH